ncbi:MAG: hypothetical protein JW770_04080 [Actinobacteria bacterium]|nr:hypothetical protein [Actinomycetota bacterium]
MAENGNKNPAENFGDMMKKFGEAVAKIFDDPELKKKAKEFGEIASGSAKEFGSRFRDDEVKAKFKDLGRSAHDFGESVADYFREGKKEEPGEKSQESENPEDKESGGKSPGKEGTGEAETENAEPAGEDPEIDKIPGINMGSEAHAVNRETGETRTEADGKVNEEPEKTGKDLADLRGGRIAGYSIAIVWSAFLLVFLNFYNSYIAYYSYSGGVWTRTSFLTQDFYRWLPVVTVALAASIIGNILLIIYDRYWFRQLIQAIMDLFSLSSAAALLSIFPFDFTVFPNDLTGILTPIVVAVLIFIIVALSIGIIVRLVRFIVGFASRA